MLSLPLGDLLLQFGVVLLELLLFVLERNDFTYHTRPHAQLRQLFKRFYHQRNELKPAVALAEVMVFDDLHKI
jgi:hypothetical protein